MGIQPIVDNHLLLPADNEHDDNNIDYESEKYSDEEDLDAPGTNQSDRILAKRGMTRLFKFRMKYGNPGGIKLKVTFDALNRVSGLHRALFSSFLGDLVREHIGLKNLSWRNVNKEERDKLWTDITVHIYYCIF
jgi:hypothetical protein